MGMSSALLLVLDVVLALGATARLTHAVTVEDIGDRLLHSPAQRWADRASDEPSRWWRRRWWTDALSCPWCVSTWIGIAATASLPVVWGLDGGWLLAWRIVSGGLTVSYLVALLQTRVADGGDYDDPEDEPAGSTS